MRHESTPRIAAAVAPSRLSRLRGAIFSDADISVALDYAHATAILSREHIAGLVVDVTFAGAAGALPFIRYVRATWPQLPVVVYAPVSVQTLRPLIECGQAGVQRIVLYGLDDDPRSLRGVLAESGMLRKSTARTEQPSQPAHTAAVTVGNAMSEQLIHELARNPDLLYSISPRTFEDLVAELLHRQGFEVKTTARTRDGGKDVIVRSRSMLGDHLYYVECKRYAPRHPVGVALVRELFAVVQADRVTGGILATTSHFTRDALAFQSQVPHQLKLRSRTHLVEWMEHAVRRKV